MKTKHHPATAGTQSDLVMKKGNPEYIRQLNKLVANNIERFKGYQHAADVIAYQDLKDLFKKYAAQSARFSSDLSRHVIFMGGIPNREKSLSEGMHQAWLQIKKALSANDIKTILESCMLGEKSALESYDEVLDRDDLDHSLECFILLESQRTEIQDACHLIQSLCRFSV